MKKRRYKKRTGRSLIRPFRYGGKQRRLRLQRNLPNVRKESVKTFFGWAWQILLVCLIAFVLVWFWGQRVSNTGNSMQPVLNNGDVVLVDRIIYNASSPKRNDVIVFKPKGNENAGFYVKRVIGLPGETVQIKDGYVYIDGKELEELATATVIDDPGIAEEPIELAGDEYFVLGDNRSASEDSRMANIGNVKRKNIYGKAWFVVSPFSDFGWLKSR